MSPRNRNRNRNNRNVPLVPIPSNLPKRGVGPYSNQLKIKGGKGGKNDILTSLYAKSILRPDLRLQARVPTSDATPSEPQHIEFDVNFTPITDSGNANVFAGFGFTDALKTQAIYTLASSLNNALTWTGADNPLAATLATYFEQYRLVSAGMRLINNTPAGSQSGRLLMCQTIADATAVTYPNNAADFTNNGSRIREVALSDIEAKPFIQMMPVRSTRANGASVRATSDWKYITDAVSNSGCWFFIVLPATTSQSFTARVYMNFELNALFDAQCIIPQSIVVGDDVERASALRLVGSVLDSWDGEFETLERLMGSRTGKAIRDVASSGFNWLSNVAGSLFGRKRQSWQTALSAIRRLDEIDPNHAFQWRDVHAHVLAQYLDALRVEGLHPDPHPQVVDFKSARLHLESTASSKPIVEVLDSDDEKSMVKVAVKKHA